MKNVQFALAYASLGWAVLPVWSVDDHGQCRCGRPNSEKGHKAGKHPQSNLVPHGHNDATTDPEIIKEWFSTDPQAGIGISLADSGLLALDIDPQNGGLESLAALEAEHGVLYSDCTATTQGGGEHRLFLADPDAAFPSTLGAGLDLKHHGYICVAPTLGPSGAYQWEAGRSPISRSNPAEPSPLPTLIAGKARQSVNYSLTEKGGAPVATAQTFDDLRSALKHVDADDYGTWVNVGLALKPYGENGYRVWTEWSARSEKFDAAAQRRKWDRDFGTPHSITYRSIFRMAIEAGWRDEIQSHQTEQDTDNLANSLLAKPLRPFSAEEARQARLQPKVLVENYLFADLRNFIAAGGVGKTTVLLHESVCGALGRPIWGHAVPEPFTTVFVTKEDSREIIAARLREIMDAMNLGDSERAVVFDRVYAVDLSGSPYKLAVVNGSLVEPHLENLDALIEHCRAASPGRIIFDPLVSFSVGESRVNDAEQGVVEAARYLMRQLQGVAVDVVHHTGKMQARAGIMDQYSGRSGSALPDGSRMVAVLAPCTADSFLEGTGYVLDKQANEKGLKLAYPKMSYAAPPKDIYILRRRFHFEAITPASDERLTELRRARKVAGALDNAEAIKASIIAALRDCRVSPDPLIRYPSRSMTIALPGVTGKNAKRKELLEELLREGVLVERHFSEFEISLFPSLRVLGGRRSYIALSDEES